MESLLLYLTVTISSAIVFKTVININTGNNKPKQNSNNQPTVILLQPAAPPQESQQDDFGWLFLIIIGLIGFLAYLYALSPKLFTDLFLIGS